MRRAVLTVMVVAFFLVCSAQAAWCLRTWDAGDAITGGIGPANVMIAASSSDGDSTASFSWVGADMDRYIDESESVPDDEGSATDDLGAFSSTKCWWTATDGDVTNTALMTTWAAPYEEGAVCHIEIGVVDLPISIGGGEAGTRDDAGREYFGMPAGSKPIAVWVTLELRVSGTASNGVNFNNTGYKMGNGTSLGVTEPTPIPCPVPVLPCDGFFKKVEIFGKMEPVVAGTQFTIKQWKQGHIKVNDTYMQIQEEGEWVDAHWPNWEDDTTTTAKNETADANGKIFMWDAPGYPYAGWAKNPLLYSHDFDVDFKNKVYFGPDLCSNVLLWDRRLVLSGDVGETTWDDPADTNN